MNFSEEGIDIVTLKPIGTDPWSRPIYKDTEGNLWKDVALEEGGSLWKKSPPVFFLQEMKKHT